MPAYQKVKEQDSTPNPAARKLLPISHAIYKSGESFRGPDAKEG